MRINGSVEHHTAQPDISREEAGERRLSKTGEKREMGLLLPHRCGIPRARAVSKHMISRAREERGGDFGESDTCDDYDLSYSRTDPTFYLRTFFIL